MEVWIRGSILGNRNIDTTLLRGPSTVENIVFESDLGAVTSNVEDLLSLLI
jgi:hypothetical protein